MPCGFLPERSPALCRREPLRPLEGAAARGTARSAPGPPEMPGGTLRLSFAPAAVRLLRKRLDPGLELQQSHAVDTIVMAAERVQFLHVCPQTSSAHFLLPSPHLPQKQALLLASLPHHLALMGSRLLRVVRRDTSIVFLAPQSPQWGRAGKVL